MECPKCKVDVVPIEKMFGAKICPKCNIIITSDIPIEKAGI